MEDSAPVRASHLFCDFRIKPLLVELRDLLQFSPKIPCDDFGSCVGDEQLPHKTHALSEATRHGLRQLRLSLLGKLEQPQNEFFPHETQRRSPREPSQQHFDVVKSKQQGQGQEQPQPQDKPFHGTLRRTISSFWRGNQEEDNKDPNGGTTVVTIRDEDQKSDHSCSSSFASAQFSTLAISSFLLCLMVLFPNFAEKNQAITGGALMGATLASLVSLETILKCPNLARACGYFAIISLLVAIASLLSTSVNWVTI